ncbi:hypothetical protein TNCT_662161 [Trichonephila clavata]|uniref:Uncharacterized protein n=1 Tax=Trichonephila clavata TaxID=2740835 RepID=A0A8X6F889_TRICU|nr:hypothetical protein TNCT_662161 [Trichonephila clavata]
MGRKHFNLDHDNNEWDSNLLQLIRCDNSVFLEHVVGDESWCHHYAPESKKMIRQLKHISATEIGSNEDCTESDAVVLPRLLWINLD